MANSKAKLEIEFGSNALSDRTDTISTIELIMADDAEAIAALEVPEDIASIDDIHKLRLLLTFEREVRQRAVTDTPLME